MTSFSRHLKSDQPKWNYEVQKYKSYNPFDEPGLISILLLSCGKPQLTKNCLNSTLKAASLYRGDLEWIFIDNDFCQENYEYFMNLQLERKVIVRQNNWGINHGLNQAWRLARGEYVFVLENDWYNSLQSLNFLEISEHILNNHKDIGNIQLRSHRDPFENWGAGKPEYCPWSVPFQSTYPVEVRKSTCNFPDFKVCRFPNAFNNNPQIYRRCIYDKLGPYPEAEVGFDPRHGETLFAERYWKETSYKTAYIDDIYVHAGGAARQFYEMEQPLMDVQRAG